MYNIYGNLYPSFIFVKLSVQDQDQDHKSNRCIHICFYVFVELSHAPMRPYAPIVN